MELMVCHKKNCPDFSSGQPPFFNFLNMDEVYTHLVNLTGYIVQAPPSYDVYDTHRLQI